MKLTKCIGAMLLAVSVLLCSMSLPAAAAGSSQTSSQTNSINQTTISSTLVTAYSSSRHYTASFSPQINLTPAEGGGVAIPWVSNLSLLVLVLAILLAISTATAYVFWRRLEKLRRSLKSDTQAPGAKSHSSFIVLYFSLLASVVWWGFYLNLSLSKVFSGPIASILYLGTGILSALTLIISMSLSILLPNNAQVLDYAVATVFLATFIQGARSFSPTKAVQLCSVPVILLPVVVLVFDHPEFSSPVLAVFQNTPLAFITNQTLLLAGIGLFGLSSIILRVKNSSSSKGPNTQS